MAQGRPLQDLTGQQFGLLTVIADHSRRLYRKPSGAVCATAVIYLVRCACGKTRTVFASALRGGTKSCGCMKRGPKKGTKHAARRALK